MTWKEFVAKAKEMGWQYHKTNGYLYHFDYYVTFYNSGEVYVENGIDCILVIDYRTTDQMYQIMKALR